MFYIDRYYILLVVPAMLIALFAQGMVSSTFERFKRVGSRRGLTGAEVARQILNDNGLHNIQVTQVAGRLTDHYDPRAGVIRLSGEVYGSTSIAAIGIAAHEAGHAVQHSVEYAPLTLRNVIIPVTNFGSRLSIPLILVGVVMGAQPLINLGIIAFSLVTIFQLITLPVEFNASSRAIRTLDSHGILTDEELSGAKSVLSAAALTYVAALITSAAQLLRLILLYGNRRRD